MFEQIKSYFFWENGDWNETGTCFGKNRTMYVEYGWQNLAGFKNTIYHLWVKQTFFTSLQPGVYISGLPFFESNILENSLFSAEHKSAEQQSSPWSTQYFNYSTSRSWRHRQTFISPASILHCTAITGPEARTADRPKQEWLRHLWNMWWLHQRLGAVEKSHAVDS